MLPFCIFPHSDAQYINIFLLSMEGSLVTIRAYQPYTLVGSPVRRLVLDLLAVYSSRTIYITIYTAY